MVKISIDAMGGDFGPSVVVPAAIKALTKDKNLELYLVGDEPTLKHKLDSLNYSNPKLKIVHASQKIEMDDPPAVVLRTKRDSSMRVAIKLVKDNMVDAVVSAGNTGALMVIARSVLKMIDGIERPAILSSLPGKNSHFHMLDLGANIDCDENNLFQFAIMGSTLSNITDGVAKPRVALLNVGSEAIKGSNALKKAAKLLEDATSINYIGYIEGNEIFSNKADVVVADGFAGNIALKVTEGAADFIFGQIKTEFKRNMLSKLMALFSLPILKRLKNKYNVDNYNGGSLLGLRGIVVKSHGSANENAFANAIAYTALQAKNKLSHKISQHMGQYFFEK